MKTRLQTYAFPALAAIYGLVLIGIISAPMRPAQAQPLAERIKALSPPGRWEAVVFQVGTVGHEVESNGVVLYYQTDGVKIIASSSSLNAPTFPQQSFPQQVPLMDEAEGIAIVLSKGYHQVGEGLTFVKPPDQN